jgi:hypothetical protein
MVTPLGLLAVGYWLLAKDGNHRYRQSILVPLFLSQELKANSQKPLS